MNSLTQNTFLSNMNSTGLETSLGLLDAPFATFMSSLDYALLMQNASNWLSSFLRNSLINAIEKADLHFRNSPDRLNRYYVKQTRSRTIITIFGEITFRRTEYQHRDTKQAYCYIDRKLSLFPRQRYDCCVEAKAKELYADHNSMIKTGKILGELIYAHFSMDPKRKLHHLPRQTIYNLLHRTGKIYLQPTPMEDTPETLYVMADEKWIPLQREKDENGQSIKAKEMTKLAVCFEKREAVLRKDGTPTTRYQLKNKYIYASCSSEKESFWVTLHEQLSHRYDLSKVKKIYILGDGASWIKSGVAEFSMPGTNVKAALDKFHTSQAIHRMTKDEEFRDCLKTNLYSLKLDEFDTVSRIARSYLEKESEKKRLDENLEYLHKHWDEIATMVKKVKIGCAMEQAISHILASHFTSVPKAYSRKNIPLYLNTRIHNQNNEDILLTHLLAIDASQRKKGDIYLHEELDLSIFDNQEKDSYYTVNIKNRTHSKNNYKF